jgi:hypothetical protein
MSVREMTGSVAAVCGSGIVCLESRKTVAAYDGPGLEATESVVGGSVVAKCP